MERTAKRTQRASREPAPVGEDKPLAKSADPDFIKFTTYIKKTTHRAVKMRMVGEQREMSDLVEDLLAGWLKEHYAKAD